MEHTLILKLPDEVYHPLLQSAQQAGETPEVLVIRWLTGAVKRLHEDPLLRLAGAFASELNDVGGRHDDYLGYELLKEVRGTSGE